MKHKEQNNAYDFKNQNLKQLNIILRNIIK